MIGRAPVSLTPTESYPPKRPYAYRSSPVDRAGVGPYACPSGELAVVTVTSGQAKPSYSTMSAATSVSTTSLPSTNRNERSGRIMLPPTPPPGAYTSTIQWLLCRKVLVLPLEPSDDTSNR